MDAYAHVSMGATRGAADVVSKMPWACGWRARASLRQPRLPPALRRCKDLLRQRPTDDGARPPQGDGLYACQERRRLPRGGFRELPALTGGRLHLHDGARRAQVPRRRAPRHRQEVLRLIQVTPLLSVCFITAYAIAVRSAHRPRCTRSALCVHAEVVPAVWHPLLTHLNIPGSMLGDAHEALPRAFFALRCDRPSSLCLDATSRSSGT